MSTVEAEEIAQAARDKREAEAAANASAGSVQSTDAAAAAAVAAPVEPSCPLASTGVFSLNTGKGKIKTLPPLPAGRYGGVAVVVGARLHFFGGWATPDRASRLAVPAAEHWSIGLNADGSSAPEWQQEAPVPAELRGVAVRALALSSEAAGEPAIYAWASPTAGSSGGLDASASHACAAEADDVGGGSSSSSDGGAKRSGPVALWVFASSTGWQQHGCVMCIVAGHGLLLDCGRGYPLADDTPPSSVAFQQQPSTNRCPPHPCYNAGPCRSL